VLSPHNPYFFRGKIAEGVGAVIPTRSAGRSRSRRSTISSVWWMSCSRGVRAAISGIVSCGNWIRRDPRSRRDSGDSAVTRWIRIRSCPGAPPSGGSSPRARHRGFGRGVVDLPRVARHG